MTQDFLIEAQDLQAMHDPAKLLVIDARTQHAHEKSHIPGAVFISTYGCFIPDSTPQSLAHFAQDVSQRYAAIGVTHDTPIVVYEQETGMRAAREMWILKWLGHSNVRMLHGGLNAWIAAGAALEQGPVATQTRAFKPALNDSILMTSHEIHAALGSGAHRLIDVRDTDEYRGLDHTECCERRGHVPGAVWVEWTELMESGRYKSPEAIRQILASRGVSEQDELVPYCHRGARSANAYFALLYAGYPRVRNFIGSMHEWSANHALPIEV